MLILPHIKIAETDTGSIIVEVEDAELCDFIEDYLTEEHNIDYDSLTTHSDENGITHHKICFSADITKEKIIDALGRLSPDEIEKIFQINNSPAI